MRIIRKNAFSARGIAVAALCITGACALFTTRYPVEIETPVLELLANIDGFLLVIESATDEDRAYERHRRDYLRHRARIRFLELKANAQDYALLEACLKKLERYLIDLDAVHRQEGWMNNLKLASFKERFESVKLALLANIKDKTQTNGCSK